jgi:hypothetical protein
MQGQPQTSSEIVEIAKLAGEFRKHYGKLIGAFLYARSLSAVRGRSFYSIGLIFTALSVGLSSWVTRHGWW